jgi:hypothetical protein
MTPVLNASVDPVPNPEIVTEKSSAPNEGKSKSWLNQTGVY